MDHSSKSILFLKRKLNWEDDPNGAHEKDREDDPNGAHEKDNNIR